jgi:pimeloyl-ACP methyl ester carboxylesterase
MRQRIAATGLAALTATAVTLGPLTAIPASAAPDQGATGRVTPVDWKPCPDAPAVECGTVTVPIDWANPRGATVGIAVARRKASVPASRIGSILVDPGGPGGSGVDWVKAAPVLSPEVVKHFDIVGFDPRGVGGSHPVVCDGDVLSRPVPGDPHTQAEFTKVKAYNKAVGESCRDLTGPLFDHVDTTSVARDMDAIRAALGEQKLNYFGISYGTLMGQQYAELFPDRIRTMVIDSNMDHSLATWEFNRTEAVAAQESFDQFVAWCARTTGCALHGQDVRAFFANLYARAARGELFIPGTNVPLEPINLISFVTGAGYGPSWFELAQELADLAAGKPGPAVAKLTTAARFGDPIPYPFAAVFCQDWNLPVRDYKEYAGHLARLARKYPDMKYPGQLMAVSICLGMPPANNPQHRLQVHGLETPVLLANAIHDPATGYNWAQSVERQLGKQGVLLTYEGWGHGSYNSTPCMQTKVDAYLVSRQVPHRGTTCAAVQPTG